VKDAEPEEKCLRAVSRFWLENVIAARKQTWLGLANRLVLL